MEKIKFTSGTLQKIDSDYYNLILIDGATEVYKATLSRLEAAQVMNDYDSVKMLA